MRDKTKYVEAAKRRWQNPDMREKAKNHPWRRPFPLSPKGISPNFKIPCHSIGNEAEA